MEGQCLYLLVVLVVISAPRVRATCTLVSRKITLFKVLILTLFGSLHSWPRGGVPA